MAIKNKKDTSKNTDKEFSFNLVEVVVIVIISILFGGIIGGMVTTSKNEFDSNLQTFYDTYKDITDNYYKKVDKEELVNAAVEGMINYLGDPYSSYMDTKETEEFNTTVNGEYEGIGVSIAIISNKVTVVSVFEESPAAKAGIKQNDVILKINGKSVDGLELDKVVEMIKKKKNPSILISRDGEERTYSLKLSTVELPSVSSKIFEENSKKVGYINVSVFSATTYSQFNKKLTKLEDDNIDSLIIDVRDNPGGHLDQVTKILSLFMDKKKVLYQIKSNGKSTKVYSLNNVKRSYNIIVLINGNSASASEILAGAMKESYNAKIVGTTSYGKGTVQKEYSLDNGSSVKYTIEEWLTPKGNSINSKGIKPTNEVELSDDYKNSPKEENDNQLQEAIKLLAY